MKAESQTTPAAGSPASLTRPFDLSSTIKPPRFQVDSIAFADLGLIALLTFFVCQSFLFSPGVPIDLPTVEEADTIVGVRTEAVATIWKGKVVTSIGSFPIERMDTAFTRLVAETKDAAPDLLLLIDRQTPLDDLTKIYESARRAGFSSIQLAARQPEANEPGSLRP